MARLLATCRLVDQSGASGRVRREGVMTVGEMSLPPLPSLTVLGEAVLQPSGVAGAVNNSERLSRHEAIAAMLAASTDEQLRARRASASPLAAGIGSATFSLEVAGAAVFVRRAVVTTGHPSISPYGGSGD